MSKLRAISADATLPESTEFFLGKGPLQQFHDSYYMPIQRHLRSASRHCRTLLPATSRKRLAGFSIEVLEQRIAPAAFIVSTTADSGAGSLRQALLNAAANGATATDTITFAITSGAGPVKTIQPTSPLPDVSSGVTIDGYSQSGSSANTLVTGNNAVLNIVLDGSFMTSFANGLHLLGNDTVKGLVIQGFRGSSATTGNGILIDGGGASNFVLGNWIGVDQTGLIDKGNAQAGIALRDAGKSHEIGSSAPADRNVISGNSVGIELYSSAVGGPTASLGTKNTLIVNNFIGTDKNGTADLGNDTDGVRILGYQSDVTGNTLRGNVISGNDGNGIVISNTLPRGSDANNIQGNVIGANQAGTAVLGNTLSGILINNSPGNLTGTANPADRNIIAFNGGAGISITGSLAANNPVQGNSIFSNGGLGIDLNGDGVTPNDVNDADAGPNSLQNFPVILSAVRGGGHMITGTLDSAPGVVYSIEIYASTSGDPTGYGEGQLLIGTTSGMTDSAGHLAFSSFSTATSAPQGSLISALATDPNGNTSEFSRFIPLVTNFFWNGSTNTDWFTPTNWSPNGVPGAADSATLNIGSTINLASSATVGAFNQSTGTLGGSGGLTVINDFHWSGGDENGTGFTTVAAGGTLTIDTSASHLLSGRTLTNSSGATATWSGGRIGFDNGAIFQNNGVFLAQSDDLLSLNGSTASFFNNAGTFTKNGGTGITNLLSFGLYFDNSGTVNVQTGTLKITSGSSVPTTGAFNVTAGASLIFDAMRTFASSSSIAGAGSVSFTSGTQSLSGAYNVTGTSTFGPAGSITFESGANISSLAGNGKTITDSGAATTFNAALPSLANNPLVISGGGRMFFGTNAVTVASLTFTNGSLYSNANFDITGLFTWGDQTLLFGPGTTNANGGTVINGTNNDFAKIGGGRIFHNPLGKTTTWSGSSGIQLFNGGVFQNDGTFIAQNDVPITWGGLGTGSFNNAGTFTKNGGTGVTALDSAEVSFNNTGTVNVQTGTLSITSPESTPSSGAFNVLAGAKIILNGDRTYTSSSSIAGAGDVSFTGGRQYIFGTYNITGTTAFGHAREVGFYPPANIISLLGPGKTLEFSGRRNQPVYDFVDFDTPLPDLSSNPVVNSGSQTAFHANAITVASFTFSGGVFESDADLNITGLFKWGGQTDMRGPGTTNANGGTLINDHSLDSFGFHQLLYGRIFHNPIGQTVNCVDAAFGFSIYDNSVFQNDGVIIIQDSQYIDFLHTGTFNNTGTFTINNSLFNYVNFTSDISFNNSGIVTVQTGGHLFISSESVPTSGSFSVLSGATLVANGNRTYTLASSISGAGDVSFTGGIQNFGGTYNITGTTAFGPSQTLTFQSGATIASLLGSGKPLVQSGGSTDFRTPVPSLATNPLVLSGGTMNFEGYAISVPSFEFTGGTFASNAALNITGPFTWGAGATMSGSGTTNANAGTLINAQNEGSETLTNGRIFHNPAGQTVTWTGTNSISISSGGRFQNDGIFFAENDGSISASEGGSFVNNGTFLSSGSFLYVNGSFTNTGLLDLQNGDSDIEQFTQTGGTTRLNGGSLSTTGSALAFQGGILTGSGTITGNVSNTGATIQPGGTGTAGAITIDGDYDQGTGGTLAVELGGTTPGQFDRLIVTGSATLAGLLNIVQINGFTPQVGNSFNVLSYASHAGVFGTLSGQSAGFTQNASASTLAIVRGVVNFVWDGGAGTDTSWFRAPNWNPDGVPTPGDNAELRTAQTISIPSNSGIASITNFKQSSGVVTGAGTLSITGTFTWSAGNQTGTGITSIAAGGTLSIINPLPVASGAPFIASSNIVAGGAPVVTANPPVSKTLERRLDNAGIATWNSTFAIDSGNGAIFNNSGSLDIKSDGSLSYSLGGARTIFNNTGTITRSAGSGAFTFAAATFNNSGTINANSGTLVIGGEGVSSGIFNVGSAGTLSFGGDGLIHTLTAPSQVSGSGAVSFGSGITNIAGSYNVASTAMLVGGGTVNFNGSAARSAVLNLLAGGTVNFNGSNPEIVTLNQSSGTIGGTGLLTVTGSFAWSGGSQTGSGITSIPANGTLSITGTASKRLERRIDNAGTATWNSATVIDSGNGAIFNNTGSLSIQGDGGLNYNLGGTRTAFNNSGTLTRSAGTGTTAFTGVAFTNTGTVDLQTGTLAIDQFTQTAGTTRLNGGSLGSASSTVSFQGGLLTGSGNITGNVSNTGATIQPGGTGAAGTIAIAGNYAQGAGGTLAVELGGTAPALYDRLTITGSATLAGSLNIAAINGFTPLVGNSFNVLSYASRSGVFGTLSGQSAGFTQNASASTLTIVRSSISYVWDGGGGTDTSWFTAPNWNPDGVPTPGDNAELNTAQTITLPVNSGIAGITNFTQSNGTVTGPGTLSVTGSFTWSGGNQTGTGITSIATGGTLSITGAASKHLERRIDNAGAATWNSTAVINSGNGAIFNNSGSLNIQSDGGLAYDLGGTQTVFNNSGSITRSAGLGAFTFANSTFNNSGTVNANTGTLALGGSGTSSGTFTASSAGTLTFGGDGGTHNLAANSQVNGSGAVNFGSGTTNVAGSYNVGTTSMLAGGVVNFNGASAGTTILTQSTGTIGGTGLLTVTGSFAWSGGSQTGSGITSIPAGSTLAITGGSKNLQRRIDNAGAATWNSATVIDSGNGAIFNNTGSLSIQGDGGLNYNLGGKQTIFNNSGTLTRNGTANTTAFTGVAFTNTGTVDLQTGTLAIDQFTQTAGTTRLNGGSLSGASSTLSFQGGLLTGSGNITGNVSNTGATIQPGGTGAIGTIAIAGNYTQGTGGTLAVELGGTAPALYDRLTITGSATLAGSLNIATINGFTPQVGNSFNVLSYASRTGVFGTLSGQSAGFSQNASASTLAIVRSSISYVWDGGGGTDTSWFTAFNWSPDGVPTPADNAQLSTSQIISLPSNSSIASFTQSSGTLTGAGTLSVTGSFIWSGGNQTGAGITSIAAGGTLSITGPASMHLERRIDNAGAGTWNSTTVIDSGNGAIFNNIGSLDIQSAGGLAYALGGTQTIFNNSGTLTRSAGTGTTAFTGVAFNNTGTINAQSGVLAMNGTFTQTAGTTALLGGGISGSGPLNFTGGQITGAGIITGNVSNTGAIIRPGGTGTSGRLEVRGNYTQGSAGTLAIEIGGAAAGTQFDVLAVTGTTLLNGTLNLALLNGFAPSNGQQFTVVSSTNSPGTFSSVNSQGLTFLQTASTAGLTVATPLTDLALTQSDGVTATTPGSLLSYTLNYRNDGNRTDTGVQLVEILPAGTVFNSAASSPGWIRSTQTGAYTLNIGALAAGASGTAAFAVNVISPAAAGAAQIFATASIAGDGAAGADATPANNTATDVDTLNAAPDLVLAKSNNVTATTPGAVLSYTLNYRNDGSQNATGVTLTETLPAGTTFNPAASAQGWLETTPGVFKLNIGALNGGGASGNAIFAVTVNSPAAAGQGQISSVATIDDDHANGSDLNPADNTASDSDTLSAAPDLVLTKSNGTSSIKPGALDSYILTYRNDGNQNATGVNIFEILPAGTAFNAAASTAGWTQIASNLYSLNIGALAGGGAGGSAVFAVTINSLAAAGLETISSSASIGDDGANGADPSPGNNTATDIDVLDAAPDLVVSNNTRPIGITTPGSSLSYTLSYRNNGDQDASGVTLTEVLPAGTSFDSNASSNGWTQTNTLGVFTFHIGNLAAGAQGGSTTFVATVNSPAPSGLNRIDATATITDDNANGADPVLTNNSATGSDTLNAQPDLQISITGDPSVAKRGGITSYTLTYSNHGNQDAAGVFLTQTLPANTTFDSAGSTAGWVRTGQYSDIYQLPIGNLPAGSQTGSATFAVKLAPVLPAGYLGLTQTALISDDQSNGADPNSADNAATATTPIYQGVYIVAPGVGTPLSALPIVRGFDIASSKETLTFSAYEDTYRGGVRLAVGDFNGDGFDDVITSTRLGSGRIRIFDGVSGARISGVFAEEFNPFIGRAGHGAFIASGDVTGDGRDDIIAGSGRGGGTVNIYDGVTAELVNTYTPFGKGFKGGVRVAVGDVNGDGTDDVVVSQGDSGTRVKVYDGKSSTVLHDFKAAPNSYRSGVFIAVGDLNNDGKADIIAGRDINSQAIIETFSGIDHHSMSRIVAFGKAYRNGVRVAATDVNFDGIADIIATSGIKGGSLVKIFDGKTSTELPGFTAFPDFPNVSLFAAATTRVPSV